MNDVEFSWTSKMIKGRENQSDTGEAALNFILKIVTLSWVYYLFEGWVQNKWKFGYLTCKHM